MSTCSTVARIFMFSYKDFQKESVVLKAKAAAEEAPTHYLYLYSILSENVFL